MANQVTLTVIQGNDVTVDLEVTREDCVTPQDLTGLTPEMLFKPYAVSADTAATAVLGPGTGLTVTDPGNGKLTAFLPRAMLTTAGTSWWRLDLIDDAGDHTTCMYGHLVIVSV